MIPQKKVERLLMELRRVGTEVTSVDAKANLPLDTSGDKAFFVRHVAALANNREPSYLLLGIENKTWVVKSLSEDLHDAESVQSRMNNILKDKLDPFLAIRYGVYELSEGIIGVVEVEGKDAPYIITMEQYLYGGKKSDGEQEYIYRGVFYVRRGANSEAARRQKQVLTIVMDEPLHYWDIVLRAIASGAIIGTLFVPLGILLRVNALSAVVAFTLMFGSAAGIVLGETTQLSRKMGKLLRITFSKYFPSPAFGLLFGVFSAILPSVFATYLVSQQMPLENKLIIGSVGGIILGTTFAAIITVLVTLLISAAMWIYTGKFSIWLEGKI